MPYYSPEEILGMIEEAGAPRMGSPEVGLLAATQAQAAATLYVGQVLENLLIEIQTRRN